MTMQVPQEVALPARHGQGVLVRYSLHGTDAELAEEAEGCTDSGCRQSRTWGRTELVGA